MDLKIQNRELDNMRIAERETKYYMYKWNSILDIQRVFRGFRGRERGKDIAIEFSRFRGFQHYDKVKNKIKKVFFFKFFIYKNCKKIYT